MEVTDWWLRHGRAKQPPGGVATEGLLLAAPASSGPPSALFCASTLAGMLTMCVRVAALGQGSRECMLVAIAGKTLQLSWPKGIACPVLTMLVGMMTYAAQASGPCRPI